MLLDNVFYSFANLFYIVGNATNDSTGSHQNNGTNVSEPQPMEVDEVVNDTAQMRVGNNTVNEISGRSNTNNRVHAASPVDGNN